MFYLRFTKPVAEPYPLPSGLTRSSVTTPNGNLEVIIAEPPSTYTGPRKQPVFFAHGGMGSAGVWIEWMTHLSQVHNIPCYAVSLRGHGFSWYPSYIRMVYMTPLRALAGDLVAGIKYAQGREEKLTEGKGGIVLVGHSSGGGLSQVILDSGEVSVSALVLVAAIPCYGASGIYYNWWKMDLWFSIRSFFHLMHPNSPLSSTKLAKRVFFCEQKPEKEVDEFMVRTSHYESYLWPFGMMFGTLVDVKRVIQRITGWGSSQRIMVLAAEKDRLMHVPQMQKAAEKYRNGVKELVSEKKIDSIPDRENVDAGVRFHIVAGAGHHVQNDLQWKDGVESLVEFYEQL